MGLREEATEPWGLLLGAVAGGLAWATGLAPLAAAGIGVAAWATKVLAAAAERRGRRALPGGRRLAVEARSREAEWLDRGRRAASSFGELAGALRAGPLAERAAAMEPPVREALASLERLAGQASTAGGALARLDDRRLAAEAERLRGERERASGGTAEYFDRALASVRSQRQVVERLREARAGVLLRMESSVLELEGLVARLVELSALATSPATEADQLEQLADELEGVRRGLAEAEEVSRRALSAYRERGER
ncbi:MAG TPA: hypothetical protein VKG45_04940 [Actinomycetes bacterium]|nr:hypothetical protein [Actinomycetes bacterium]